MRKKKERPQGVTAKAWNRRKELWAVYNNLRKANDIAVSFKEFLKTFKWN